MGYNQFDTREQKAQSRFSVFCVLWGSLDVTVLEGWVILQTDGLKIIFSDS